MPEPTPAHSPLPVTHDIARGAWLAERLGAWATVGGVAGSGFETYARIFHPATGRHVAAGSTWPPITAEDLAGLPRWESLRWTKVAELAGRTAHPLMQWNNLVGVSNSQTELAGGWVVNEPEQGWLDPGILAALVPALAEATTTPDALTLAMWEGWGALHAGSGTTHTACRSDRPHTEGELADIQRRVRAEQLAAVSPQVVDALEHDRMLHLPGRTYVLFASSLAVLADESWPWAAGIGWRSNIPGPMPQLIWPDDHAWCVASELDWDSTIVAGPRSLLDAVLSTPGVEAAEITEAADLTWDGDLINPRPS